MSIVFKNGDMFTSNAKYLCHQVNCMGKMGSGIAKTVREKFPTAFAEYSNVCLGNEKTPSNLLGNIFQSKCGDKIIVHMFAQEQFGRSRRYTDYDAFLNCLKRIRATVPTGSVIAFPHGIGCGLGGGSWSIIFPMIEEVLAGDYEVEVWKYGV